jgi:hypothetical protein
VEERLEESDRNLVDEVKEEWRQLWLWRIDDKVRAEGVADRAYPRCFVERGTVIVATRDFKPLDLKEILSLNQVQNVERVGRPHPAVGGWRKFARTVLNNQARSSARARRLALEEPREGRVKSLQLKKGGRGWMHRIK